MITDTLTTALSQRFPNKHTTNNRALLHSSGFKNAHSFLDRSEESRRVRERYPERIPIIVEKSTVRDSDVPNIDKRKYLVPYDLTVGQFVYVIRKRIKLRPEQAIFVFVKNVLPPTAAMLSEIYQEYKDEDDFLYITYSGENTFGNTPLISPTAR